VHPLFRLSKNHALSKVIGQIKGESSKWLKETFPDLSKFSWQSGYAAFSVSESKVEDVTTYISNQREHHRTQTFKEEFRLFLKRHQVEYQEQYLWD
jgi:putative transposase